MGSGNMAMLGIPQLITSLTGHLQQPAQMPNLPPPPPPPQQAKMPDVMGLVAGMNGTGQAGGARGPGQTFLTGASGVDPNSLKLSAPTLLGE